jgi:hypothetical protein
MVSGGGRCCPKLPPRLAVQVPQALNVIYQNVSLSFAFSKFCFAIFVSRSSSAELFEAFVVKATLRQ